MVKASVIACSGQVPEAHPGGLAAHGPLGGPVAGREIVGLAANLWLVAGVATLGPAVAASAAYPVTGTGGTGPGPAVGRHGSLPSTSPTSPPCPAPCLASALA